ncbi:MAG: hypothetical protein PUC65_09530 [Clostridiales bacterium]|nr:hypothetical protein [Clostridiales bacterium]
MHKIINGLRYGNAKTKSYILTILCLLLFGTFSIGMVIATKEPLWGMSIAFCFILAFILMQSVSFQKSGKLAPDRKEKRELDGQAKDSQDGEEKPEDHFEKLSEKDVRNICIKYKVRKDHRPIMVDSCASKKIFQCPAYAWMEKDGLALLLFEKEPRKITFTREEIATITYERNVSVNMMTDYHALTKASFIKLVFASYLPTVFEERLGQKNYKKNLYVIGKDLKVTNTSAKTIMSLLSLNLTVSNLIRDERYHNPYFESAYALNIMLKDTVLSVNEYKIKMRELLQKLTDAKISNEDFVGYMNQLVQGRLITREYAEYYMERRK